MSTRIGHGYDIHRLQESGRFRLAGVLVSDQVSPIAHSDGDVILHAVVDAILGALGEGDIGELFSDTDPAHKNADSAHFVRRVVHRAHEAGFRIVNIDVTLLLEKPKIAAFKPAMKQALVELLGADAIVNIKATTHESCDAVGRGEAVAAHAVVLLAAR